MSLSIGEVLRERIADVLQAAPTRKLGHSEMMSGRGAAVGAARDAHVGDLDIDTVFVDEFLCQRPEVVSPLAGLREVEEVVRYCLVRV